MRLIKRIFLKAFICVFSLLTFIFSSFANDIEWELAFTDDFQQGFGTQWIFSGEWLIEEDAGNYFMHGSNHQFVECRDGLHWYNYKLQFKLKIDSGTVHINTRMGEENRYFTGITTDFMYLRETVIDNDPNEITLHEEELTFPSETWVDVEIRNIADTISIYFNDTLFHKDTAVVSLGVGTIAFESLDNSSINIDDILVYIEKEEQQNIDNPWYKLGGPIGGLGYDIRIHPHDKNIMLVTDNPSGVNKSYNAGKSWSTKNTGLTAGAKTGAPIFSLTIDPGNPNIVWCGTQNFKGIYKSVDQGETWTKKDNGILDDNISFRGFAIHPNNSDIVFAAAEIATELNGIEFNKTKGRIYRTIDGGDNWETVWAGDNMARVLLFDYNHPDTIYCSTGLFDREAYNADEANGDPGGEGILKSTDGGDTWTNINNGIDNLHCGNLAMHPTNSQILYTVSGNNAWSYPPNNLGGGVYKTINGGESWEKVLGDELEQQELFAFVTISPSYPDIVYAGSYAAIHKSEDGGESWVRKAKENGTGYGPDGINAGFPISAVVDPDNPDKIFVNNYGGGNFVSIDGADSWTNASKGYTGAEIHAIAVSNTNNARVYINAKSGLFGSDNGGIDWNGLYYGEEIGGSAFSVAVNPLDDQVIFATNEHDGTIFKSTNGGYNWTMVFNHPEVDADVVEERQGFKSIEYALSDTSIIYAGCIMASSLSNSYYEVEGKGIYKSTDGGNTWFDANGDLPVDAMHIADLAVDPTDPDVVYAGTYFDGLYKTTNGGENWIYKGNGLTSPDIRTLKLDPNDNSTIYAGTASGSGIYKSTNGGETFVPAIDGTALKSAAIIPGKKIMTSLQGNLKAATLAKSSQFYSKSNWSQILDIVIDPTNSNKVYVADFVSGVYVSEDGGTNWMAMNTGFPLKNVTSLGISSDGTVLYLGSYEGGMFRQVIGEKAPQTMATIPDNATELEIFKHEMIDLEVLAFDLNNDTLSYKWLIDNVPVNGNDSSSIKFKGPDYTLGKHSVTVTISDGKNEYNETWDITILVSESSVSDVTLGNSLLNIYPVPATLSQKIVINYTVPQVAIAKLCVYDLNGRNLNVLVNKELSAGNYSLNWNGTNAQGTILSNGIYVVKINLITEKGIISRSVKVIINQ